MKRPALLRWFTRLGQPLRKSFFRKLFLSVALLVIVSAALTGSMVLSYLRSEALRELETSMYGTGKALAAWEGSNPAHLWSERLVSDVKQVSEDTGLHVSLFFANGDLAAETSDSGERGRAVLEQPEIVRARASGRGGATRAFASGGEVRLITTIPILSEYEIIGYVRVAVPLSRLEERNRGLQARVIGGAILTALGALAAGYFLSRHFTRPLAVIDQACQALARGDLDQRIPVQRVDEIGTVAGTINQMAAEMQRRMDEERREKQRLSTLLAVMSDGVAAITRAGRIAYLNDVAARWLGVERVSVVGQLLAEVASISSILDIYDTAVSSGQRCVRELRLTGYPAAKVVRVEATPLGTSPDRAGGILMVFQDLTEIRELEGARREFTANVSHELKTPLAAISALVDATLDDPDMPEEKRIHFLRRVRHQGERLRELVQELLMISRLEGSPGQMELSEINLASIVMESTQTFVEIARRKGLDLECQMTTDTVMIRGHHESVSLIMNNLLHNAINHTSSPGLITVTVTQTPDLASVSVRDTGIGIAVEHQERIFERFYRVDRGRSRHEGGTGLGLSIVKHLTQAMGGRVWVESRVGEGAVFTVEWPAAPGA